MVVYKSRAEIQASSGRFRRLGGLLPVIRSDIYRYSKCFLFAIYAVFQAENFPARRCNFKIQTVSVKQLVLFPCFGGLGVFDLSVVQLHFYGIFSRYFSDTAKDTVNFRLLQLG